MKFGTAFAIALSVIAVFGVAMAAVTIAMLSQTWEDKCTAPQILNGVMSSTSEEFENGDFIDSSMITCDANHHLNTNSTNLVCVCQSDGEACEELQHVCVAHLCTTPNVTNGEFFTNLSDLQNGTSLDASDIVCDSGYVRTSVTNFLCLCSNHGDQCATIQNACEVGTTTSSPNSDPDDSSDSNEDLELSSNSSGIPDWALALIIVGDIVACVLLSVGIWACWDYHDKRKAEQYWNLYMEHRSKNEITTSPPVAIEVQDITIRNDAVSNKVLMDVGTPIGKVVKPGSRRELLVSEASMMESQAKQMEERGDMNEAVRLYTSASEKLQEAVKGTHASDETFGLAVRASKYEDKAKQLRRMSQNQV